MRTKPLLITNNKLAKEYCEKKMECMFLSDCDYISVLEAARDYIHMGHKLLSHPMAGSLKPNQTPYKSVVLETLPATPPEVNESVLLIESSIEAAHKFFRGKSLPNWSESIKKDFQTVDLSFLTAFTDKLTVNGSC